MPAFKVYLPKEAEGYRKALHTVQERFCDLYGGFTQWDGTGGYEDHDGNVVTEPVTVVMADYNVLNGGYKADMSCECDSHIITTDSVESTVMFQDEINPLGKDLREQLPEEESIMLVVDGEKFSY